MPRGYIISGKKIMGGNYQPWTQIWEPDNKHRKLDITINSHWQNQLWILLTNGSNFLSINFSSTFRRYTYECLRIIAIRETAARYGLLIHASQRAEHVPLFNIMNTCWNVAKSLTRSKDVVVNIYRVPFSHFYKQVNYFLIVSLQYFAK
jgi:hypothetical protein